MNCSPATNGASSSLAARKEISFALVDGAAVGDHVIR